MCHALGPPDSLAFLSVISKSPNDNPSIWVISRSSIDCLLPWRRITCVLLPHLCVLGVFYRSIAETEGNGIYSQNGACSLIRCWINMLYRWPDLAFAATLVCFSSSLAPNILRTRLGLCLQQEPCSDSGDLPSCLLFELWSVRDFSQCVAQAASFPGDGELSCFPVPPHAFWALADLSAPLLPCLLYSLWSREWPGRDSSPLPWLSFGLPQLETYALGIFSALLHCLCSWSSIPNTTWRPVAKNRGVSTGSLCL